VSKIIFGVLAGLLLGATVTWTLLKHKDKEEKKTEEHAEAPHVFHTNGQTIVKLEKEGQQHAGLQTAPLEAATLRPEVKAYGRVLDPAPLAAQVVAVAGARVALDASLKDFQRLKLLHEQDQNVSTRALEIAEGNAKRDQLAVDAAELALLTAWGKPIVAQPDLPAFVRSLATRTRTLVRVDVPLGTVLKSPPTAGRIAVPAAEDSPLDAQWLGPASSADPQTQGQGFLLLLENSSLPPGAAVVAWLTISGEETKGVTVPRSAVIRHEGEAFVYVQIGDELFERKEIELERPTPKGWFVEQDMKAGQRLVIVGAQQLLSDELQGQGGGEE
jgi:hypothetical protein